MSYPAAPSDVSAEKSLFDRFAGRASGIVSRAPFFTFCMLLVVVWLPSYFLFGNIDTWQLVINTLTTIVTFLLVALLQNSQTRADQAVQQKLNAIADGLADLMAAQSQKGADLSRDIEELRAAVGLEERESA
jgi:low affinity Fe/Cu permease